MISLFVPLLQIHCAVLGSCVFGTYDPTLEASLFITLAMPPACVPCTWTLGLLDSIYTVAETYGTDWISVWSLNSFLIKPDQNQVLFQAACKAIFLVSINTSFFAGWNQHLLCPPLQAQHGASSYCPIFFLLISLISFEEQGESNYTICTKFGMSMTQLSLLNSGLIIKNMNRNS